MNRAVILCVDDENIVLDTLKEQLKRPFGKEFNIQTIDNGAEALEFFKELLSEKVDIPVIITDHAMPGLKGDELIIEVCKLNLETRNILLTGQADANAVGNVVNNANLYRYISKPWEQDDLVLTTREAINSYFESKQLKEALEHLLKLNRAYQRFVPHEFLKTLGKDSIIDVQLNDQVQKRMSILFSDIRQFSTLSESMTPEENFRFINSYLNQMGPLVRENHGFIDKYIGDAIMALFDRRADDAIAAAILMLVRLAAYNQGRQRAGYKTIQIGIGINTGNLILGTLGEENRMEGTVISDAVNVASRLEGLTKQYRIPLIISEHTFNDLENPANYAIRFIDRVLVKGKSEPLSIYEVFDTDPREVRKAKIKNKKMFEDAIYHFHFQDMSKASQLLEQYITQNPFDTIAKNYLQRCQNI
ncbi:MAG: response regulator [Desulfamplus sp.]|nr:response regulator [Desulfamplus sp.]